MMTEADRRLAAYAEVHHGVFTLVDADEVGLTRDQIRERVEHDWVICHQGVFRVAGSPDSWFARLFAAAAAITPHGAVSYRSAAALFGLPGGRTDIVEVSCRRWLRSRQLPLVVHESRRLDAGEITAIEGIAVTCAERVVVDLASLWPSTDFLEAVMHAARRKRLISYESMDTTFRRHARRGLRGVPALRAALDRWSPESRATESEMETLLVQILRGHGCPEPTTQFDVCDGMGKFVARVDLAIPEWNIAVEYDSKQEHSDEFQIARDARRRNRIVAAGYAPLVARHRDLLAGGTDLYREIVETRRNWRHRVG